MLLILYVLFFVIALTTIGLSIWVREPYYALVGFFFLFYISAALMVDGIDYESGNSITTSYSYVNGSVNATTTTTTYLNTTYENNYTWWFGFLLALTSAFSFGFVMYDLRQDRGVKRARELGEMP